MTLRRSVFRIALLSAALAACLDSAHAARYTYHGDLLDGDEPADGAFDLRVRVLASPQATKALAPATELPAVPVVDGRFSVELDLPDAALATMWVEVAVREKGDGDYEVLGEPRPVSKANSTCPGAWALDGNTGVPAGSFLGLADPANAMALELRARNLIVARFTPAGTPGDFGDAPRVSLGSSGNFAGAIGATVGGGGTTRNGAGAACPECANTATGPLSTVAGGGSNTASGTSATIGGGGRNDASGVWSTIGGGVGNDATGDEASTIAGGESNLASGRGSAVGGGLSNVASGDRAVVAGGDHNEATVAHAGVGGGSFNEATGQASHIGGGQLNHASAQLATIAGGAQNLATEFATSIGGGQDNLASAPYATVPGGSFNRAVGAQSLAAGASSCAGGNFSVALGDKAEVRAGNESTDVGCSSGATSGDADGDEGTFAFSDTGVTSFRSSGPNQFIVRARGGVGINTAPSVSSVEMTIQADADEGDFANLWLRQRSANANGMMLSVGDGAGSNNASFYLDHYTGSAQARRMELLGSGAVTIRSNATQANTGVTMAPNAGSWSSLSDRRLKTAIEAVDPEDILARLRATPVSMWSYTAQGTGVRHIGPMAQDFAVAFEVGENDTTISTIDADGVALAAIQGVDRKLERENAQLRATIDRLAARLARLEAALERTQ